MHTLPAPHGAPFMLFPVTTQLETPLLHEVVPILHASLGWQAAPSTQAVQLPLLHTRSLPHDMPLPINVPVSTHWKSGAHTV